MSALRNIVQQSKGIVDHLIIDDPQLYQLQQTWKTTILIFFIFLFFIVCVFACVNMYIYTFVCMHVKIRVQHQLSSLISLHRFSSQTGGHQLPRLASQWAPGMHLFLPSSQVLGLETCSQVPSLFLECCGTQTQDFCHDYQLSHLPHGVYIKLQNR